jgi:SNF2 family DNA or RNA helicase
MSLNYSGGIEVANIYDGRNNKIQNIFYEDLDENNNRPITSLKISNGNHYYFPALTNFEDEEQNQRIVTKLHEILRPFLLRRMKKDVLIHLPSKREIVIYCPKTKLQQEYYNEYAKMLKNVYNQNNNQNNYQNNYKIALKLQEEYNLEYAKMLQQEYNNEYIETLKRL